MNQFDEYKRLWQLYKDQIEDIGAVVNAGPRWNAESTLAEINKILNRKIPAGTDEKTCALMAELEAAKAELAQRDKKIRELKQFANDLYDRIEIFGLQLVGEDKEAFELGVKEKP